MRGREDESFSSISPTSLSAETRFFLRLVVVLLLLRLAATVIIREAESRLFPAVGESPSAGQLARLLEMIGMDLHSGCVTVLVKKRNNLSDKHPKSI